MKPPLNISMINEDRSVIKRIAAIVTNRKIGTVKNHEATNFSVEVAGRVSD